MNRGEIIPSEARLLPVPVTHRTVLYRNLVPPTEVTYTVIGDDGIFEGDIILGSVTDLHRQYREFVLSRALALRSYDTELTESEMRALAALEAIAIREHATIGATPAAQTDLRWLDGQVPFVVNPLLSDHGRVHEAINHWHDRTPIRFVNRTNEDDYVEIVPGVGCSSNVGKRGGRQVIKLGPGCNPGNIIHELGHTIGLWHEQSRSDRDRNVRIDWANVQPALYHNFNQHITDGDDIGPYDYQSIMHYDAYAFAVDPAKPTIMPPPGVIIGQRICLSDGDIAAVVALYQ